MPLLLDREDALDRHPVLARTLDDERAARADPPRTPEPRPDHRESVILQADPPGARSLVAAVHRWLHGEPVVAVALEGPWLPDPAPPAVRRELAAWIEPGFEGGLVGRPRELLPVLYRLARDTGDRVPVWFGALEGGFAARICPFGNLHVEVCSAPGPLHAAWDGARLQEIGRCVERDDATPLRVVD